MKNSVVVYLYNGEYHFLESIISDLDHYNIDEFNDLYSKLNNPELKEALNDYFLKRIYQYGERGN